MSQLPALGTLVRIPWGFTTVEGEVVDAYDSGLGIPRVVVRVNLSGLDEYPEFTTVTLPLAEVEAA